MNYIDYCKWRGDLSFIVDPFNEIDNIIFSQLVYINFDYLFQIKDSYTIEELSKEYHNTYHSIKLPRYLEFAPNMMHELGKCNRYKNCVVRNYVSKLHNKNTEQFAAMTIDILSRTSVICFRGTDDSLIGWKEDGMLTYKQISSQIDALDYLINSIRPFKKYILLGHSKGGNLALHAAVNCNSKIKKQIIKVYSDDGPGLNPEFYKQEDYDAIKDRYTKIMPEDSLVGTIYDRDDNEKIITKSSSILMFQHDPISWQVIGKYLDRVKNVSSLSMSARKGFEEFFASTNNSQRQALVDGVFGNLEKANINELSDFMKGGIPIILQTLKYLGEMDPSTKKVWEKLIKSFIDIFGNEINKTVSSKLKYMKEKVSN